MAALNLTQPSAAGTSEALTAASAGGDSFPFPSDGIVLRIRNAHATLARTLTLVGQQPCNYGVIHNGTVNLPADTTVLVDIAGTNQFRDTNGRIQLTYSDAGADLSLAATSK